MPRKPTSVYVIVEHPSSTHQPTSLTPGVALPATNLQAWRIPLEDGDTTEDVAKRAYQAHPIGATITVVEDTRVQAYRVGLTLDELDDPRLPDPEDEEGMGTEGEWTP